jgi:outer membrane receptor for ferrienterochelin and colicins
MPILSIQVMRVAVALLVVVLAWPAPLRAADPYGHDIEDLDLAKLLTTPTDVWTATKTEQKSSQAPAIITTITREQIAVWGYRSVSEVLSHELGFYVVDDGVSANLAVRGISGGLYADSSIIKVLIDGHEVAFHSTGGNWLGPELIPLSAVDRIEIVRGPGSALFGADAFLGVINIKTRSGKGLSGATASLGAGQVGGKLASDVDIAAGFERGDLDVVVGLRRNGQDLSGLPATTPLPSDDPEAPPSLARGPDQRSSTALARISYRPREGTELGLFGYYSALTRGSEDRVSLSQLRAGLFAEHDLRPALHLSIRGSVFRGAPGDDNRLDVGSEYYYIRRQFGFRGGDLDAQVAWTGARNLSVVVGASQLVDDELLPSRIGVARQTDKTKEGDILDAISIYQARKTFLNSGAYLQGIWNVAADLFGITGGVRYDRHNIYGNQISERIGLVSSPLPTLHAKLLFGSAFKAPSPTLLYTVPSTVGDVLGNPDLKPQYVRTLEAQVAAEPAAFFSISSNVAYSVLTDKTEFVQEGINQVARNVARAATLSWETTAELKYKRLVRTHVSVEVQRTVRRTGQEGYTAAVVGTAGDIYPRAVLQAGVAAQPTNSPVRAAVQASYVGARRASDTNSLLNTVPYQLPHYLLLEATLSTRGFPLFGNPLHEVSLSLTGKNLLGATGPTPGFSGVDYPLAPRAYFLQVNISL